MIIDFITSNLLASYGAAVGTLALALNFMRYRHAVSSSNVHLKLEIIVEKTLDDFETTINLLKDKKPWEGGGRSSLITHKVKVRNVGGVTAHIQDVWVQSQSGKKSATMRSDGNQHLLYRAVSERGNVEISPRSSLSFYVFSDRDDGYLEIKRAYAIDETGKQWRS